jgi:hypothetical protein
MPRLACSQQLVRGLEGLSEHGMVDPQMAQSFGMRA